MANKGIFKKSGTNKKYDAQNAVAVWSNGKMIRGYRKIDSLNFTLHYASPCVWEGIRSYKQADGTTAIWKLEEHIARLFDSAKICGFEIPYTHTQLVNGCKAVVEAAGSGDLYLRPVAYSSGDAESAKPSQHNINVDIYCFPLLPLHNKEIDCIISSYTRSYPHYQMQAKTAENYSFLQKVKPELKASNADEAFLTDNNGYIVEATVANIFLFKGKVAMTPPNNGSILPGITRKCVADILQSPKLATEYQHRCVLVEKNITRADVYTADCIILCGTYAEIVKVGSIDGRRIDGDDRFFKILKNEYAKMTRGR